MLAFVLTAAVFAPQDAPSPVAAGGWDYVVPAHGDGLRRPPLRALPLGAERPEEVSVSATFQGAVQRWGMLRYGDPDSTRVAIVLDQLSATEALLYVDDDRDLLIDPQDLVSGDGRSWEFSLAVATRDAQGRALLVPRRVALELGKSGAILGAATLGWLEGRVRIADRAVAVRRRDGDANGFFSDQHDQLWLDRDADGVWAPLSELFIVQPILSLDGARYALRSGRLGADLSLALLEGAGRVRLEIPGADGAARDDILDAQALLVGRDGSAVLVRAPGEPTEVPIGEYRLGMVTLRYTDPEQGQPWSFVFSEAHGPEAARWRRVAKDEDLSVDPIGELDFSFQSMSGTQPLNPGNPIMFRPELYTGDHLLINMAYRGRETPSFGYGTLQAKVRLVDSDGVVVASGTSGFA